MKLLLSLWNIYLLSAKVSLMSFGGIYSFWAILNREAVRFCNEPAAAAGKAVTFCRSEYDLVFAFSEMLPGPQVNVAAILGYGLEGVAGMLVFLLGLLTPAFLISPVAYAVYRRYGNEGPVKHFLRGTGVAVIAILLTFLGAILSRAMPKEPEGMLAGSVLLAVVFVLSHRQRLHPMLAVGLGAAFGFFLL